MNVHNLAVKTNIACVSVYSNLKYLAGKYSETQGNESRTLAFTFLRQYMEGAVIAFLIFFLLFLISI